MDIHIIVILFIGVVSSQFVDDEPSYGYPVQPRLLDITKADDCNGIYGAKCANCTHLQFCASNEVVATIECGKNNRLTPFCINDACSSQGNEECKVPTSNFLCTGVGLYPDISDCTRYYLCSGIGSESILFQCPPLQVYDSRTGLCMRRRTPRDCVTIDCNQHADESIVLEKDRSVLVICADGGAKSIVLRCSDHVTSEYDPLSLKCNFKCPGEGRYPDRLDCHQYYECFRNSTGLHFIHQNCGLDFKFDRTSRTCQLDDGCEPEVASISLPPSTDASTEATTPLPSSSSSTPIDSSSSTVDN